MKKILFLIVSLFIVVPCVSASNKIDSISLDIYIDNNGNAHVKETWDTYSDNGTEFYKIYNNIGTSEITNLKVTNGTTEFETLSNWDIDASFEDKKYKAGINYTSTGLELCMGISEYGDNSYTFSYDVSNFVVNLTDSQMIYWNLVDKGMNPSPEKVYIKIYSDFRYEDTFGIWGYGNYGGTAYVYDGYIEVGNDSLSSDEYVTILVQFPIDTFNLTTSLDNDFQHYLDMANEGATAYSDENKFDFWSFIAMIFWPMVVILSIFGSKKAYISSNKYKAIKKEERLPKNVEYFREIPCNKDLFKAYFVANRYNLMKKQTDFLGAVLLKWLLEKKVEVVKGESKILKKETTSIRLFDNLTFDRKQEEVLYDYMTAASKDNILEKKEFERWCKNHYNEINSWFNVAFKEEGKSLEDKNMIIKENVKKGIFNTTNYNYDLSIYEDGKKMKGLKKFLNDFSKIDDRSAIEVNSWEYYLMYAQIFGIAKKVAKEFKDLYPDTLVEDTYNNIIFIHGMSYSAVNAASVAQQRAQSYSSGGGGFSSGGGGGGSFGGGGGGSR